MCAKYCHDNIVGFPNLAFKVRHPVYDNIATHDNIQAYLQDVSQLQIVELCPINI